MVVAQGRTLLLASLGAWVVFTLPLSWVQPTAVGCVQPLNASAYRLVAPNYDEQWPAATRVFRAPAGAAREGSPLAVDDALNYKYYLPPIASHATIHVANYTIARTCSHPWGANVTMTDFLNVILEKLKNKLFHILVASLICVMIPMAIF